MTKRFLQCLILIVSLAIMNSCYWPVTDKKEIYCPEKTQNCLPKTWSGSPMDTSASYQEVADYYYVFESLRRVNSPEDEWSLSFINKKHAALTFTDADQNRMMMTRLPSENMVTMESGMGVPLDGHIGAISIQGDKAAFAAALSNEFIGSSDIYTANMNGNVLTDVKKLGPQVHESQMTWESHPALSPNGKVIIFASDRYHGTGEIDLWFIFKKPNGEWSDPINCGEVVNSRCDELTPFITPDGRSLLFSSCGHETVGGYDIFMSRISDAFWIDVDKGDLATLKSNTGYFRRPSNLRPPLNTPADELFPSTPNDMEELLYYSSNQAQNTKSILSTKGGFDLYLRKKIKKYKTKPDTIPDEIADFNTDFNIDENFSPEYKDIFIPEYTLEGVIYNARTKLPAKNAELTIREIIEKYPSFTNKIIKDTSGKFEVIDLGNDKEFEVTAQSEDLAFEKFKIVVDKKDTLIVVKADENGEYKVTLEKDREFEVTAQAEDLFFESFKLRVDGIDTLKRVEKSFFVPEQLQLRINFPTANFDDPYKYTLDSNAVETNSTWIEEMDLLAKNIILSQDRIKKIILIGHTDEVGTKRNNKILGQNRVNFVVKELIKRKVPKRLLEAASHGEEDPLPKREGETLATYRKRNRRVELQRVMK